MIAIRNCYISMLALLFLAGSLAAQSLRCTQRTVAGTYALAYDGTVLMTLPDSTRMPVPVAGLSKVTIDLQGEVSALGYMASGDTPQWNPQISGTMTVNADCRGQIAWKNSEGDTVTTAQLIVQNGGDEISSIMLDAGPVGAPIVAGRWKRISRALDTYQPCGAVGTYVARESGINILNTEAGPVPAPGAMLARGSIDYSGAITMSGTAIVGGKAMPFTLANGRWEEGTLACTGRATGIIVADLGDMGSMPVGQVEDWFLVLDGGNELWGISIADPTSKPVALWTVKRVSRKPAE